MRRAAACQQVVGVIRVTGLMPPIGLSAPKKCDHGSFLF